MEFENNNDFLQMIEEKTSKFFKLMSYYKCAIMETETKLNVLNEEFSIQYDRNPIHTIKSRLKSPSSIKTKLDKLGVSYDLEAMEENLHDIAGLRVCCSFIDDVYMLADALLRQSDVTLIEKKDYIKTPKANGYRSLHLIISIPIFLTNETKDMQVEIQLRTIAMDSWASLEHQLHYKKDACFTPEMAADLYRCAELSAELDEKMGALHKLTLNPNQN